MVTKSSESTERHAHVLNAERELANNERKRCSTLLFALAAFQGRENYVWHALFFGPNGAPDAF